ncbi:MAG: ABC transporter permease [bacterium]
MKIFKNILKKEMPFLFACPAILWQFLFLYIPLFILFFYSFIFFSPTKKAVYFTIKYYSKIFELTYLQVIFNSFLLAFLTSVICLFIAYPIAYFLVIKVEKKYKTFLLVSLILPSWTSLIVQIYAWFFLLENNIFVFWLKKIGLIPEGLSFINNYFSILIGTVYCWLPFMILPIYAVLDRMDKNLLEASADLGASRFETLKRVVLPISVPGILAGSALVFIPVFGEFAIPILLGGGKIAFWGNIIVEKFLFLKDWKLGSAFAFTGVMLPLFIIFTIFYFYKIGIFLGKTIFLKRQSLNGRK